MNAQSLDSLVNAGLFGIATALMVLAFCLAGFLLWQMYAALWSPQAKRNRAFQRRLVANKTHNRKMLGLSI